jgi:hypothetical protein
MSWLYQAAGWLLVVEGAWAAGWALASLVAGRTTVRKGYWRDAAAPLLRAAIGLAFVTNRRFESDTLRWPLIIVLSVCLIGFLVPFISMRRWYRSRRQSGGPTAEPS